LPDDESPVLGTRVADLSGPAFLTYHQLQFGLTLDEHLEPGGLDLPTLLRNWRLLQDLDGEPALRVAGGRVLGQPPQRFRPHRRLSAVALAGPDQASASLDRREITGRWPTRLDDSSATAPWPGC
jgi:hypothetical protein